MTATTQQPIIDPALSADVQQLQRTVKELAKRAKVNPGISRLADVNFNLAGQRELQASIVLLTETNFTEDLNLFLNWLSLGNQTNLDTLFDVQQESIIKCVIELKAALYHYKNSSPCTILSPTKSVVKIIFYDKYFLENEDAETTLEQLDLDTAICFYVNCDDADELMKLKTKSLNNAANSKFINLKTDETQLDNLLEDESIIPKTTLIRLCHYVKYIEQVNNLLKFDLKKKSDVLLGKAVLAYKKQLINERSEASVSSRDGGQFKTVINKKVKAYLKEVEGELESLAVVNESIATVKSQINQFIGFKEIKGNKNITIKLPPSAVEFQSETMQGLLSDYYTNGVDGTNAKFNKIENDIKTSLSEKGIYLGEFKKKPVVIEKLTQKPAAEFTFEKPYEKQIQKKGIGQLLMDLRTPIFMLMPFMMIAGVFGSLMGGKDVGQVDDTVLFYNSRPCIAITQLPQSTDGEFRRFIEELDDNREKGMFNKEIKEELIVEPQLAVVKSIIQKANNRQNVIEELDYFFDDRKHIIYLFLTENADRQLVKDQLFDPSLGLLNIQGKSSRMTGMSGLAKALSGLKDYRFFIIGGLLSLVTWFIVTRKKSMADELKEARQKEQKKLRLDWKMDFERAFQQSNNKWKVRLNDYVNEYQTALIQFIETGFSKGIDNLRETKVQESGIINKRLNALKTERRNFSGLTSDQQRNSSKITSLMGKLKRQINRSRR